MTAAGLALPIKYWASAIIPGQSEPVTAYFSASGSTQPVDYRTDFFGPPSAVAPSGSVADVTHLFAGAKEVEIINGYEASLGIKKFDLMIDWGWFYFITKPMFRLIDFIYHYVGNFEVAILIVTVLVKAVFFPLANHSGTVFDNGDRKGWRLRLRYAQNYSYRPRNLFDLPGGRSLLRVHGGTSRAG